jgi:hypothetical protein
MPDIRAERVIRFLEFRAGGEQSVLVLDLDRLKLRTTHMATSSGRESMRIIGSGRAPPRCAAFS